MTEQQKDRIAALRVEFQTAVTNGDWVRCVHLGATLSGANVNPADLIRDVYADYEKKLATLGDTIRLQQSTIDTRDGQIERLKGSDGSVEGPAEPSYTRHIGEVTDTVCGPADFVLAAMDKMLGDADCRVFVDGPVDSKVAVMLDDILGNIIKQSQQNQQNQQSGWSLSGASVSPILSAVKQVDVKAEMAMAWHNGHVERVMAAFEAMREAGKDPVAFVKRMKNVAVPPDND